MKLSHAFKLISALAGFSAAALQVPAANAADAAGDRKLAYSFNLGVTSDYIFRGFSQTARRATGQAGADLTYGIFYAGLWASGLDFGKEGATLPRTGKDVAKAELDLYFGFKPVVGPITFDLGGIAYLYPNARDKSQPFDGELNYFEFKGGMSGSPWKNATLGGTVFYSPDYTNSTGNVWTLEGSFSQEFAKHHEITPTFSALVGYQSGNSDRYKSLLNGVSNYTYWNAGMTFAIEKFSLDLRYWDTNVANTGGFCDGSGTDNTFQCNRRFMGTFKFTY